MNRITSSAPKRQQDARSVGGRPSAIPASPKEEEQRRLLVAADIHDDSVQAMLAADLKLEALRQRAGPDLAPLVDESQELVREAAKRLRLLLFELAPLEPGLSLGQALERYLKTSLEGCSFTVVNGLTSDPSAETATLAYRIAQEALTNVRKHSCASTVSIELREINDGLLVEIADNGKGFTARSSDPGHLGLAAMRIRAEQGGGWLTVDSRPGKGTVVTFWLKAAKFRHRAVKRPNPSLERASQARGR